MERNRIPSNSSWAKIVGYSRAIRIGNMVFVSGTTATNPAGTLTGIGDPQVQTLQVLENIENALESAGSQLEDVVQTRIYITDMNTWEQVGKVHGEFFKDILPVTTLVEVSRLASPDMLVEIEAVAVCD